MVRVALFICVLMMSNHTSADIIHLIDPLNGDNRIAAISGVRINGTAHDGTYDFVFHHGMTYDNLETVLGNQSPILWTNTQDGLIVINSIALAVNQFGDVSGIRTDDILLPYSTPFPNLVYLRFGNNADNLNTNYSRWFDFNDDFPGLNQNTLQIGVDDAFITATLTAVPEPSSFTLFGFGVVAISLRVRNRKRRARTIDSTEVADRPLPD